MANTLVNEPIHLCFGLHDKTGNYSKYIAAAICSIWENTCAKTIVHILHDDTLTTENITNFNILAQKYRQRIVFHPIPLTNIASYDSIIRLKYMTIGSLFRLLIPVLLSESIERAIYLDGDIIANLDILELWQHNIEDKAIAACRDSEGVRGLCQAGLLNRKEYFNAGVMLIDLNKLRNANLGMADYLHFLTNHQECKYADQDALNYFFRGQIYFLPTRYNNYTYFLRNSEKKPSSSIYHFAGDYVHLTGMEPWDRLFFIYLLKTPWGDSKPVIDSLARTAESHAEGIHIYQCILQRISSPDCKRIVFGARSDLRKELLNFFSLTPGRDYYLDNDEELQGKFIENMQVYTPKRLLDEDIRRVVIIVLSNQYYADIRGQLVNYGLKEDVDFFDGRKILTAGQGGRKIFI